MPEVKQESAIMWFIKTYEDGEVRYVMSV